MGDWLVKRISVDGFQGYRAIDARFGQDPWFLIGRNGAGKTTLIELLNASLRLDYGALQSIAFASVEVEFFDLSNGAAPTLRFERATPDSPRDVMTGSIEEEPGEPRLFVMDSGSSFIFEDGQVRPRRSRGEAPSNEITGHAARAILRKHLDVSWLSVHRGTFEPAEHDEDGDPISIAPIDSKLHSLTYGITRYFSSLDSRAAQATQTYQQNFFLSLLARTGFAPDPLSPEQVNDERQTLREIFLEFGLTEEVFGSKLKNHFDAVERTSRALQSGQADRDKGIDMLSLFDTHRIHDLIEQWRLLEAERTEIYRSKTKLRDILNSLLYNKTLEYTERNSISFATKDVTRHIDSGRLSSGEKQMFILLAEAMLQEDRPCIYLADEPELSLHVDWQESLVNHIRSLNENAQIIFATHSPDIVSSYNENVIRMETL